MLVSFPVTDDNHHPAGQNPGAVVLGYQAGGSNHPELNRHQPHHNTNTKNIPERDIPPPTLTAGVVTLAMAG